MNVTELARKLKLTTSELLEFLPKLGFDIGRRAIKIDSRLVDKIIVAYENHQRQEYLKSKEVNVREVHLADKANGAVENLKIVRIPEVIIVRELADKMNLPVAKIIGELMKNGVMSSLNERIDFTTASIIAEDLGFKVEKISNGELEQIQDDETSLKLRAMIKTESGEVRPPVVVVMGHVDHGKTKLLDAIRQTNVAGGESGGITQHIGAYQAEDKGRLITFLDTPGHEAFRSMRSRGSKVADIAIVVVAADDGLQPQTLEVLEMVQKEKIPFVIAINKIDKEGADIDRVKKELSEINLAPEDWGGKTICVPISAKEKKGLKELLDMVLLVADLESFTADANRPAIGTIIESHVDKGEGPVATALIQAGTLRPGDMVIAGTVAGKVKALKDFKNNEVSLAGPSMPVKILGLRATAQVGDILEATEDKKRIKEITKNIKGKTAAGLATHFKTVQTNGIKQEGEEEKAKPSVNIVLKTDVLGSLEAIAQALESFSDPEVDLKIIKRGLGLITDVDVLDAVNAGGVVMGFGVKPTASAEQLARDKNAEVLHFDIIYRLFEEMEKRLKALLKPEVIRTELGRMKVLAIFKTEKKEMIVGGRVLEGKIKPQTKVKVIRGEETITVGDALEMHVGKEKVEEAVLGEECGIRFVGQPVIQKDDILEIYQETVKERQIQKIRA